MVASKTGNPERSKKILKGNQVTLASSMLIISEFTSTSFSQQVNARSVVVISSTFRVTLKYSNILYMRKTCDCITKFSLTVLNTNRPIDCAFHDKSSLKLIPFGWGWYLDGRPSRYMMIAFVDAHMHRNAFFSIGILTFINGVPIIHHFSSA